jgi:hypothetical protein
LQPKRFPAQKILCLRFVHEGITGFGLQFLELLPTHPGFAQVAHSSTLSITKMIFRALAKEGSDFSKTFRKTNIAAVQHAKDLQIQASVASDSPMETL